MNIKDDKSGIESKPSYLFDHFSLKVMMSDIRFSRDALRPDQVMPDMTVTLDNGDKVTLYELAKNKPLLLVTGSITCPMTISGLPLLKELQETMGDKLNIALVYVREAHPGEYYPQPAFIDDKRGNALDFKNKYEVDTPIIIDDLDGPLHKILDVKPNSVHLIDGSGKILLQSLWAGDTKIIRDAINHVVDGDPIENKISQKMFVPFFRGAGFMHDTLKLAGDRSYKELMHGAPPIWILSRLASFFDFIPRQKRGGVAALFLLGLFVFIGVYVSK